MKQFNRNHKFISQTTISTPSYSIGATGELIILVFLTIGICFFLVLQTTKHLPFHQFSIAILCISIILFRILRCNFFNQNNTILKNGSIFILGLLTIAFISKTPLSVNSISITVKPSKYATNFILWQTIFNKRESTLVSMPPNNNWQTINFILSHPLTGHDKAFHITFNKLQNIYRIKKIGFNTLILWKSIPLHIYKNRDMLYISGTISTLNILSMEGDVMTLRSRYNNAPFLHVLSDENYIRSAISPWNILACKGIWLAINIIFITLGFMINLLSIKLTWIKKNLVQFLLS